jgi:hypothetical protein
MSVSKNGGNSKANADNQARCPVPSSDVEEGTHLCKPNLTKF